MRKQYEFDVSIRQALDARFSGVTGRLGDAERVLRLAKGEEKPVKKKLSAAFVLVMVLVLAAVTALAVGLLSGREFVQQVVAPIAQEDASDKWTREQAQAIIRQATENGLRLPDDALARLEKADSVYKEELMRAFAKIELGFYPASWSLEDQAWYDELLVRCGLRENRSRFLPEPGEISEEKALQTAIQYIHDAFSFEGNVTDAEVYKRYIQYMLSEDVAGNPTKVWDIEYESVVADMPSFYICITPDGTVIKEDSYMNGSATVTASNVNTTINELCDKIVQNDFYTVDNMAEFAHRYGAIIKNANGMDGTKYSVLRHLLTIPYGKPSDTDIPQEKAFQLARAEILTSGWKEEWLERCKYTISYRVYSADKPEWRICFKLDGGSTGENYAYFHSGEMPFGVVVRLDAKTGDVISTRQLDEMDRYDYYCEFPDERDAFDSIVNGVG